jgi:hypothetical protein
VSILKNIQVLINFLKQPRVIINLDALSRKAGQASGHKKETDEMASMDEQILRATKEIVVKFIEGGRISPSGFRSEFTKIYHTVEQTVKGSKELPESSQERKKKK